MLKGRGHLQEERYVTLTLTAFDDMAGGIHGRFSVAAKNSFGVFDVMLPSADALSRLAQDVPDSSTILRGGRPVQAKIDIAIIL